MFDLKLWSCHVMCSTAWEMWWTPDTVLSRYVTWSVTFVSLLLSEFYYSSLHMFLSENKLHMTAYDWQLVILCGGYYVLPCSIFHLTGARIEAHDRPGSLTHWKKWFSSLFSSLKIAPFCSQTLAFHLKTTPFSS